MRRVAVLLALLTLPGTGCGPRPELRLSGRTMGTTWQVTLVGRGSATDLQEKIERRLEEVNQRLSTYREDSEICRFNRFRSVGEEFPISGDFLRVMKVAARVFELSGGAWDGTVLPLVDLWGFGPAGPVDEPPGKETIAASLARVGFAKIAIRDSGALVKREASVTLDLASIAKGYGVDQVAELVRREGFTDFIVEIGGEIRAGGARRDGRPWRVGINRPRADAAPDEVYRVAFLRDEAFATSGDYRNYFVRDGVRYSHVLDPRTGRPITNRVVSVSIRAPDCTLADGLATAVMVMGAEAGLALVERLDDVEGLVVVETPEGGLQDHPSTGFHSEPPPG
jgi:thiamine biosynthesis lipoprotein